MLVLSLLAAIVFAAANAFGLPFLMGKVLPAVFGDEAARAAPLLSWPERFGGGAILYLPKGHEMLFAVAFLPVVMLIRGLGEFFSTYLLNLAGLRVIEAVRRDVFGRLQQMHLGFFGRHSVGDLMARLITDANSVRLVLVDVSNDLIVQPLTLVFALGYVIWVCFSHDSGFWFLTCLLVVPLAVLMVRSVALRIQRRTQQGLVSSSDLNSIAVENLQSAREIRAYGLQEREGLRFDAASREGLRIQGKLVRYEKVLSPLIELTAASGIAAAIGFGAAGGFTLPELLSLIVAFYFAYGPIKRLGNVTSRLSMAAPGLARLEEILRARSEVPDAADARPLARVRGDLEFVGVNFGYGAEPVLAGVTLSIPAGQSVALVGPSGAGKSTFVNLVPRFFDPQQGVIRIDGQDLRSVRQADLRANIALVSQEPVLFNESILENIRLGRPAATAVEVRPSRRRARLHRGPARRFPDQGRRARRTPFRRPAPARLDRPRLPQGCPGAHPRRGHVGPRHGHRAQHPAVARAPDERAHDIDRRAPLQHHPRRRPRAGLRRWSHRGGRPARGGLRFFRVVPAPLGQSVQESRLRCGC